MSEPRKICVVTGSRAEYGLLYWTMRKLSESPKYKLQIIATGMHLSKKFAYTFKDIINDGFKVDCKVDMNLKSDTPDGILKSISIAQVGFSKAFLKLKPDLILMLGDRYELLAAANAALIHRIPIAHCHGGERTEGLIDEAIRHSITKMSHIHFVSCLDSYKRVVQLGENPSSVNITGAFGIENLKKSKKISFSEFKQFIGLDFKSDDRIILVTYHPVTLEDGNHAEKFNEVLTALSEVTNCKIIFTGANSDTYGSKINSMIRKFVLQNRKKAILKMNLGQTFYISALKHSNLILGNSSSGILEAPSFKTASVNIGDRQKGRIRADSVIDCSDNKDSILLAINEALSKNFQYKLLRTKNPYDFGYASGKVIRILDKSDFRDLIKKRFYDIQFKHKA